MSNPKLLRKKKNNKVPVRNVPPNFTDLRAVKPKPKLEQNGIQDIVAPRGERRFRLWRSPVFRIRAIALILIFLIAVGGTIFSVVHHTSPISEVIKKQVKFDVYYPDPAKIPAGYSVDYSDISVTPQALIYTINGHALLKLFVSEQTKPPEVQLHYFYTNQMQLHTDIKTNVGTAAVGAIGAQTVVSLPTNTNTWLLISANQPETAASLRQILVAFRR
jgi:hypothetical protein